MNYKVLYNPNAGSVDDTAFHAELEKLYEGENLEFYDITKVDYKEFFPQLNEDDAVIIAGGDGTLNRYVNETGDVYIRNPVYYYAAGNGNDFWSDIGKKKGDMPVELAPYVKDLPTVTVNGRSYKFINGVGYGIDGYCCEVGDKLKAEGKPVNYTSIAINGCLSRFKPCDAEVIVDGKSEKFKKVWIAPTMNGRYYGGGMMPRPHRTGLTPSAQCRYAYSTAQAG